jgi:hypothetical protein
MAVPVRKAPPPPPIAVNDPVFNHWLHDLTAFIAEGGGIDTGNIPGYDNLVSTVSTHTDDIVSLNSEVDVLTSDVLANTNDITSLSSTSAAHTSQINANTTNIATNTANISTLFARSQVFNGGTVPNPAGGVNGDWYADTVAHHVYVKSGGVWVLIV